MALIDVLEALRECLCSALAETPGGPPCFCCVIHSQSSPLTERDGPLAAACGCGTAWVRMLDLIPRTPPRNQPKLANGEVCDPETGLNAVIELGVLRCTNVVGTKPDQVCECLGRHAAIAAADMIALVTAVTCCGLGGQIERVTPIGSSDQKCAGSALRLTVGMGTCIDCENESP